MLADKTMLDESFFVKTKGLSMYPFLRDDDKVIVKRLKAQDLRAGDIILYKDKINGQTVCHRFVKKVKSKDKLMLFTRADAGGVLSTPVPEDNLIGRVVGIVRDGRITSLRTKQQITLNWLNAKFYIFLKQKMIHLFSLLQNFTIYRKLLKKIFSGKIEYCQLVSREGEDDLGNPQVYNIPEMMSCYRFFALYKNREVASVVLRKEENSLHRGWCIYGLGVRVPFRGAGIGDKLMQKVIQFRIDKNITFFYTNVSETNSRAINFYNKLGFREVTRTKPEFYLGEKSESQIVMRLDL